MGSLTGSRVSKTRGIPIIGSLTKMAHPGCTGTFRPNTAVYHNRRKSDAGLLVGKPILKSCG